MDTSLCVEVHTGNLAQVGKLAGKVDLLSQSITIERIAGDVGIGGIACSHSVGDCNGGVGIDTSISKGTEG